MRRDSRTTQAAKKEVSDGERNTDSQDVKGGMPSYKRGVCPQKKIGMEKGVTTRKKGV